MGRVISSTVSRNFMAIIHSQMGQVMGGSVSIHVMAIIQSNGAGFKWNYISKSRVKLYRAKRGRFEAVLYQ